MPDPFSVLAGLGLGAALLVASVAAWSRRRGRPAMPAPGCEEPRPEYHLPPSIEAAEREIAVLLRRMRAYLRDPYDFGASRITSEAAFDDCLDRAAALGGRIAELGGAAPASPAERERARGLILEGLLLGRRAAMGGTVRAAERARPAAAGRRPAGPGLGAARAAGGAPRSASAGPAA